MKTIKIKMCHKCGKEYTSSGTKYCSEKCRNRRNNTKSNNKEKTCLYCGIKYIGQGHKYCSVKCRAANHSKKRSKEGRRIDPLIQFIIEYLEGHVWINARDIAREYIDKKARHLYHQSDYKKQLGIIKGKVSGYFRVLTAEGYKLNRWSRGRPYIYKKNEAMVKGFKDFQNGLYCKSYSDRRNKFKDSKIDLWNYDWRNFEDLEKNALLTDRGKEYPKMYFLGTIENTDPHFLELFNSPLTNI